MNKVHYENCPVCGSNAIQPLLTVKDHSVSGEEFVLWQCSSCSLRFTQDVPDQDSIGPYYASPDYISHSNTNKGLLNKAYQQVRSVTLAQKAALIEKHTGREGALLDVGAGTGAFLHTMRSRGWKVTGLEPDEGAKSQAKKLYGLELGHPGLLYELGEQSFDAITLWHVLEHVHDLHRYVERLGALLKPGGRIFIAVPNYTALDASAYGNAWAAYDVPRHLYHFSPQSVEVLVGKHGLQLVDKLPMWFDSFYISLLSSKYRKGRTGWLSAGWNGLRSNLNALLEKDRCSSLIYIVRKV
jgi:SAM-dependent methyltransferase